MILSTSITQSYLERSQPFFASAVNYWPGRRICFTIGFTADIEGWETIQVTPECKWRPKNRQDYYSMQHGEFITYLNDVPHDEMVLFCDSDMILQRPFDLEMPATNRVLVTACSFPQLKLFEVIKNLKCKRRPDKFYKKYSAFIQREFCACWIMAKVSTWRSIYAHCKELYPMLNDFEHHAAWQLLINTAVTNNMQVSLLPEFICNASWYTGTKAYGNPLQVEDKRIAFAGDGPEDMSEVNIETVYFNHTKFN